MYPVIVLRVHANVPVPDGLNQASSPSAPGISDHSPDSSKVLSRFKGQAHAGANSCRERRHLEGM
jgi:hypothetical protein